MTHEKSLLETAREILAASPFAQTEVSVTSSHAMLTRYGDNVISQNVEQKSLGFNARVVTTSSKGAKTARVSCDQTDAVAIKTAYERLGRMLDVMPESDADEIAGLFEKGARYADVARPKTALPDPEAAATSIKQAAERAAKNGFQSSGVVSATRQSSALVNSRGLELVDELSDAEFACTMEGKGGSGRGFSHEQDATRLAVSPSIERAFQKCADSAGRLGEMTSIDPGHYDVVLEPAALAELLAYFGWVALSGKAYLEDRVFCRGKLGEKLFSENVTLLDDPFDPHVGGARFDGFGVPKKKVSFVERGVLKELATDAKTAARMKREPTGHGMTEPNASDPVPWNLALEWQGQKTDEADLISRVKRGVLVTQFHYTNVVDVMVPSFTGMTRNGTFLIENGKVTRPIRNMRFTQSMVDVFNNIEAVSRNVERVSTFFGGASLSPTALVRGFHFSSGTGF